MIVLVVYKRFRHLIVGLISFQVVAWSWSACRRRCGGRGRSGSRSRAWAGWAMPSRPVAFFSAILVTMLYSLVPKGRWRQAGKWVATGLVTLLALVRMYLGVDTPSDVLVGAAIGVTIPLLAFRWFTPNEVFPVSYRRAAPPTWTSAGPRPGHPAGPGRPARPGDRGGQAVRAVRLGRLDPAADHRRGRPAGGPVRQAVRPQPPALGPVVQAGPGAAVRPPGGREAVPHGAPPRPAGGLRPAQAPPAGLPTPRPYGFVELTPDREYLLVFEFFDGRPSWARPRSTRA